MSNSLDPSNYDRESRSRNPTIAVRFRGECRTCSKPVQATIARSVNVNAKTEYIRCTECGTINRCGRSGTRNRVGGGEGVNDA